MIDQYIMKGGKVLWLVDGARISLDSLSTASQTIGIENKLNLSDQLFNYGVRINADLVQDVQCLLIPVNTARMGDQPKYEPMPWYYSPLALATPIHPISKNLAPVKTEFVSSIDFVNEEMDVKKTPLLVTSTGTHVQNIPSVVSMDVINVEKNGYYFNKHNIILGAVLEGVFPSVFKNRMVPQGVTTSDPMLTESKPTKMVVIADGDVIRNDVQGKGENMNILPLGYDRYMNQQFSNKELLLNAVNYLTDDDGWMALRSREIKLRLLNKKYDVVICDRYTGDARLDLIFKYPGLFWPETLFKAITTFFPKPDLSLLLWIDYEEIKARAEMKQEPFPDDDKTRFLRWRAYDFMRDDAQMTTIETTDSIEATHQRILACL